MKKFLCIAACSLLSMSYVSAQMGGMHFSPAPAPVHTAPAVHTNPAPKAPPADGAPKVHHSHQVNNATANQTAPISGDEPKKKKKKKVKPTDDSPVE